MMLFVEYLKQSSRSDCLILYSDISLLLKSVDNKVRNNSHHPFS